MPSSTLGSIKRLIIIMLCKASVDYNIIDVCLLLFFFQNAIASWKSEGYFQLRIISVLCKQIVPNFYELSESEEGTVTDALTSCSFHLAKKPYNWCKYSRMVAVESFCVDFVVSCCESVVPDEHSLNWIPRRTKWLKGMCKVYSSLRRGDHPEILSETLKIAQGTTSQANRYTILLAVNGLIYLVSYQ